MVVVGFAPRLPQFFHSTERAMTAPIAPRRWFAFLLRSLPLLIAVVALPCSGRPPEMLRAPEEKAAVEAIEKFREASSTGMRRDWSAASRPRASDLRM